MNLKKLVELGNSVAKDINLAGAAFSLEKYLPTLERAIKMAGLEIRTPPAFFEALFDNLALKKIKMSISDTLTILKAVPKAVLRQPGVQDYVKATFPNRKELVASSFVEKIDQLTKEP